MVHVVLIQVVLAMNSTSSVKNEITNQISLEEVKNPQKLIEHILDGIDEIISK
jgi:endonuclease III